MLHFSTQIYKLKGDDTIKKEKTYNGLSDVIFKQTFCIDGSEDILKKFLEEVLDMKINHLEIITPVIRIENVKEWQKTVDLLVKADNTIINVELNKFFHKRLYYRNYTYMSAIYHTYMKRNIYNDDDINDDEELPKFIQLNLNYNFPKRYKYEDYDYEVCDKVKEDNMVNNINFITYNVDKVTEKYYNKGNQKVREDAPRYAKYLIMLNLTGEELQNYCKGGDEVMTAYAKRFNDLTREEIEGLWFDPETEEKLIRNMIKNEAFDDGEKLGIAKEKATIAKNLIKMSMPFKEIAKATGLSEKEITKLQASL